ncbi:diguanylate cyclase [Chitinimonas viridis]|uniref:Diguanylate cyclase n=1 Tax=Chitinimonas viridis TaxID=664880 RepID=A0ABT8B0Y0_9NEIS|nr:diguanylate cyclase [Chitinimonas viridis]MDN3575485.1 diguanylate cyclase [Chitinimonas viridis]
METLEDANLRLRKRLIRLAGMLRIARYGADHDVLTGLPNRRLLYDRLRQAMAISARQHRQLAVLMLDLDGFKAINDTLGHAQGDLLLQQVAYRLNSCLRVSDTAARLGGDEFVIMLPEINGALSVLTIIEKIQQSLSAPYLLATKQLLIGASIGVALYNGEQQQPRQLIELADRDMYRIKISKQGLPVSVRESITALHAEI